MLNFITHQATFNNHTSKIRFGSQAPDTVSSVESSDTFENATKPARVAVTLRIGGFLRTVFGSLPKLFKRSSHIDIPPIIPGQETIPSPHPCKSELITESLTSSIIQEESVTPPPVEEVPVSSSPEEVSLVEENLELPPVQRPSFDEQAQAHFEKALEVGYLSTIGICEYKLSKRIAELVQSAGYEINSTDETYDKTIGARIIPVLRPPECTAKSQLNLPEGTYFLYKGELVPVENIRMTSAGQYFINRGSKKRIISQPQIIATAEEFDTLSKRNFKLFSRRPYPEDYLFYIVHNRPVPVDPTSNIPEGTIPIRGADLPAVMHADENYLFPSGLIEGQIRQRNTGNCYLLALLFSMRQNPQFADLIRNMIHPRTDGQAGWDVYLYGAQMKVSIAPDEVYGEVGKNTYGELKVWDTADADLGWQIIQRAHARYYSKLGYSDGAEMSSIGHGGKASWVAQYFIPANQMTLIEQDITREDRPKGEALLTEFAKNKGQLILTAQSHSNINENRDGKKIYSNHLISIRDVNLDAQTVELDCPLVGQIHLTFDEFFNDFCSIQGFRVINQQEKALANQIAFERFELPSIKAGEEIILGFGQPHSPTCYDWKVCSNHVTIEKLLNNNYRLTDGKSHHGTINGTFLCDPEGNWHPLQGTQEIPSGWGISLPEQHDKKIYVLP